MLLNKIKLTDFRQFYGDVELIFATTQNKNVTVIHAENGVGKTALLNAIKWAFFAKLTSNFRNPKNLVNDNAKKNGRHKCRIEIEFEEDGREFMLQRFYDQKTSQHTLKVYEKDGETWGASKPEPELVINSMLPKEMAEYFFFQGEGSNAVDTGNNQSNLANSIRDILGFRVSTTLINSLSEIITTTRKQIAAQDNSGESQRLNDIIQNDEQKLETLNKSKESTESTIPKLEMQLEEIEKKLALINNLDLNVLRGDERKSEIELIKLSEKLSTFEKNKYANISQFGWAVFGTEFADASLDFIDESQLKGRIPEPYNKTFIEDILSAGKCICGDNLEMGSLGYKRITAMLEKSANPQLLQRLSGIRAQIQDISTLNSLAVQTISNTISSYDDIDVKIQETKLTLKNINNKISAIPEQDINKLQKTKNNIRKDLNRQRELKGGTNVQIERIKTNITSNSAKLQTLASNNKVITALSEKKEFAEHLKLFLKNYLDKMEKDIRLHVLSEVNETLKKFSRHDFHIKVSEENFRFYLKDKDNNDVGQGDGLNLLLNLTITASLINFAASRKRVKDPILNSATVAPLVIDAPFGVLDQKYRNVVVKELPKHANQVIFLVSSSQWTQDMDEAIRNQIGSEYCLIMEESSGQDEKELDKIIVNGNEIITSRYDCDIDRTLAQEI